ncbi:hypothetical protein [Burkholderia gladioli]|uniref:hypothetical protein n=1 Tax=Burkholderia gladioli TaxID=28095 RepID=UPI00163F3BC1|nr:hypothetical protein [Burkholderia gladioli]
MYAPVPVGGALLVDAGTIDNMPGHSYGLRVLPPRVIDLMLASNETGRMAADRRSGATIVDVPTGYASSFDRNMEPPIRQRLYDDGYSAVRSAICP